MDKKYQKPTLVGHSDGDRKNSWYWAVLVKNLGSRRKAEQAIIQSRKNVDILFFAYNKDK